MELLCDDCEQRFGKSERQFNDQVFAPFHNNDQSDFLYGPWLHYYLTSLAWRTLVLDLPGLDSNPKTPRHVVAQLVDAEETMRDYLLGATHLANCMRVHAMAWTKGGVASSSLAAIGPNVMLRRSVFGYTVVTYQHGYSGIIHNLAGFMSFLIIKGNPRDVWDGTKVDPKGGQIKQPQRVSSWLMGELLDCIVEAAHKSTAMSPTQGEKIREKLAKNPTARALRFQDWDKDIRIDD